MDPRYLIGVVVFIVVGWFALGIIYNLRHGSAMLKWMQGGLPKIGERTTFRWLGSSVAELKIAQAKKPFRQFELLVFLAPRDVPWLWAYFALRGRRDTLILRGQLGAQPKVDLELADARSYTGRMALSNVTRRGWESQPYQNLQLMAPKGYTDLARSTADTLTGLRDQLSPTFYRFALRRSSPHLEVHIPFPDPQKRDPAEFFETLRSLARAISQSD